VHRFWVILIVAGPRAGCEGVFRSTVFQYLRKAHTHDDIDGTFGQLTTELGYTEFHDVEELLEVLQRKIKNLGIDSASKANSTAYEIAECADWASWSNSVPAVFKNHGGPQAPHTFKFVRRDDLGKELEGIPLNARPCVDDLPSDFAKHDNDVVLITRGYMSDRDILQVTTVASFILHKQHGNGQPRGTHFMKAMPETLARSIASQCQVALTQRLITEKASLFLTSWSGGTLQRPRRQLVYNFLDWRWDAESARGPPRLPIAYDGVVGRSRPIAVMIRVGGDGPADAGDDDAERPDSAPVALAVE